MLRILNIATIFSLLLSASALANTQQGLGALQAGNFPAAIALLSPQAQAGDADAQFGLCGMYFLGQGVPVNDAEAFQWCKLAADQGHVEAMFNTGLFYQKGQGVGQSFAEAVNMYEKAADLGHKDAQFNLLQMYNANVLASQAGTAGGLKQGLLPPLGVPLDGAGNPVSFNPLNEQTAQAAPVAAAIPQAAEQQVPAGVLGQLSRRVENTAVVSGQNVGQVAQSVVQAPAQIATQIPAQVSTPSAVQIPTAPRPVVQLSQVELQKQRANSACLEAARQGIVADNCVDRPVPVVAPILDPTPEPIAEQQVASVAPKKKGVKKTISWFEKQAELGDLEAQNNLGVIYRRGTGVTKNPEKALGLFEKSAARGSVNGMLNLANMYKLGEGAEQNLELSYAWYSLASDRMQAGESKRKALGNIKEIAGFMDNQQIGSALEYVTQLDSTIPMIDESKARKEQENEEI